MYISYVAKARLFTAVFSQLSIFTADCLHHPIQMAGVETIWELHTLSVISVQLFSNCTLLGAVIAHLFSVIAHLFNQSEVRTFQIRRITLLLLLLRAIRPSNNNSKMATVITAVACCCCCKGTWMAETL